MKLIALLFLLFNIFLLEGAEEIEKPKKIKEAKKGKVAKAGKKSNVSLEAELVCGDAYCQVNYDLRKAYEKDQNNKGKVDECMKGKLVDYTYCLEKSTGAKAENLDLERRVKDRFIECYPEKIKSNTTCSSNCKEDPLTDEISCWLKFTYISKKSWQELDVKNHECLAKKKLRQSVDCRLKANLKYYKKIVDAKFIGESYTISTKIEKIQDSRNNIVVSNNVTEENKPKDSNSSISELIIPFIFPGVVILLTLVFI